ncbi:hypothetical protein [Aquibium sp. ELW1220]|uniref:hypothetical protein n=1 Tax=Aquibium sp. ELW1220 TaxID=2976766 RepID=UPI0025AF53EE|nr:hypothetical protein [Aquibium sp. ELW1220]MDN2582100.1 hypothetical protein [Aquibium sp. ELW1220]
MNASIGHVHSRFEEFNDVTYGDLAGLAFPGSPEWSNGLGGRYDFRNGIYLGADAK